jgi:hypothetical protein
MNDLPPIDQVTRWVHVSAELWDEREAEHDETPITGQWLERHGLPVSVSGYWQLPAEYTATICGYTSTEGDRSTLIVGTKRVSINATLGDLRTACRLFNVPMPTEKEAGK